MRQSGIVTYKDREYRVFGANSPEPAVYVRIPSAQRSGGIIERRLSNDGAMIKIILAKFKEEQNR